MEHFMFTIKDVTDKQYVDTNGGKYDIEGQDYLELVEQKPAWSEEDCNRISSIKYLLHELDNYNFDNWLDLLKDRVQPKQEWSEEDEKKRKRIMRRLSIDGTINNKDLADINDWLKSLK